MVRLQLNGQFRGLYAEVEQVDKTLLQRFHLKGAALFKAASDDNPRVTGGAKGAFPG